MSTRDLTAEEREELRRCVLEVLAHRHPVALPPAGVRRAAERELGFAISELELISALEFWRRDGKDAWLTYEWDTAGATKWWQATSSGLLAVERGL